MSAGTATPNVFRAGLPVIDYDGDHTPAQVYPQLRDALAVAPIAVGPYGPEVLSHELVKSALRDPRLRLPPGLGLVVQGITSGPLWDRVTSTLLCMEGPEHHRLRSLLSRAFTPRAVQRLHDTITDVITSLVDHATRRGHCDVVTDIARPYPVPVICALLGAPAQDWEQFSLWADDIFQAFTFTEVPDVENIVMTAWRALDDYTDAMIERRRHTLTDDLLSDLIRAEDGGDRLDHAELRMLAAGILLAGTDTTRNQVAASIDLLCDHPDQWQLLCRRPELALNAVHETMRYAPIACSTLRVAGEDLELGGVAIPAGTMVILNFVGANRDPAVFDEPDRFDITRSATAPIMTFGAGVHYCIGANLAKTELAEALKAVTRRWQPPRRTGPAPWKPMVALSGPKTLPLAFD
ncbi:cytochrome P450 [Mycobacterium sp. SMC-4]|uniref:cytochrome P450 n=1 Tax=Mycobacterium sp. SMC-4 TaxID=2857059 RepID=UPI003D0265AD